MIKFPYDEKTEILMIRLFNNLSEKDKRHYASVEAVKLGHGGIKYISNLFGISTRTIHNGTEELKKTTYASRNESDGKEVGED